MAKNEYSGLGRLVSVALVAGSLIGCGYENPSVNGQSSNYPKVESRIPESKSFGQGLEGRVGTEEKSKGKRLTIPEVSYETAYKFFEPELIKAKASPESMKNFKEGLEEDENTRNLLYAVYKNPRKFEEDNCKLMRKEVSDFKKSPLDYITDERLSDLHSGIPFIPRTKKELEYLKDTSKLSDKQYGDLIFLIIDKHFTDLSKSYFQGMIGIH